MTKKELEEVKEVLMKFRNDENNNNRPEVFKALALIEIDLLRRYKQSRAWKNNLFDDRPW